MHLPLSKVRKAIALRFPSDSIRITVFWAKSHVQMVHMRGIWACKSRTSGEYSRKRSPKEALSLYLRYSWDRGTVLLTSTGLPLASVPYMRQITWVVSSKLTPTG